MSAAHLKRRMKPYPLFPQAVAVGKERVVRDTAWVCSRSIEPIVHTDLEILRWQTLCVPDGDQSFGLVTEVIGSAAILNELVRRLGLLC